MSGIAFALLLAFVCWLVLTQWRLGVARKSLKVQRAMLEQLEHLNALAETRAAGPASGGRFASLAGE